MIHVLHNSTLMCSVSSYLTLCMTYHNVLRFDVSVYNAMTVKKFNCSRFSKKKNNNNINTTVLIAYLTTLVESVVMYSLLITIKCDIFHNFLEMLSPRTPFRLTHLTYVSVAILVKPFQPHLTSKLTKSIVNITMLQVINRLFKITLSFKNFSPTSKAIFRTVFSFSPQQLSGEFSTCISIEIY